jgi:hypothetical protein
MTRKTPWKKYRRLAEKILQLTKENDLDFDLIWLEHASAWILEQQVVTPKQQTAMHNVLVTVRNLIKFKKIKAWRKHGNPVEAGRRSSDPGSEPAGMDVAQASSPE